MKFVCDDRIPFLQGVLEPYGEVVYLPGSETTPEVIRDAVALITRTRTICSRELLEGSSVKAIATATIGFDHIDTAWCEANGIEWKNAPGCNSGSVAQYVASVLVSLAEKHTLDLPSMTLGVVGVGNVGSKVANVGRALGMRVLLCDPPRARREDPEGFVDINTIVAEADIVTLHVPMEKNGPDATWHLFDSERLASMRSDQFLINSSRGGVVDNAALKQALEGRKIAGAVLDTWENEPAIDRGLLPLLDAATPHIAGYSADGKAAGTAAAVRMIARKFALPLEDWSPKDIPAPRQAAEFTIEADGKTSQEILTEAILHTYKVSEDTDALVAEPGKFEYLRGHYPVRREFGAYTINLKGGGEEIASALKQLGFKLL